MGSGSGIVTSRKRKLREFFAVARTDVLQPVPILGEGDGDALEEERVFLEVGDVLKYVFVFILWLLGLWLRVVRVLVCDLD